MPISVFGRRGVGAKFGRRIIDIANLRVGDPQPVCATDPWACFNGTDDSPDIRNVDVGIFRVFADLRRGVDIENGGGGEGFEPSPLFCADRMFDRPCPMATPLMPLSGRCDSILIPIRFAIPTRILVLVRWTKTTPLSMGRGRAGRFYHGTRARNQTFGAMNKAAVDEDHGFSPRSESGCGARSSMEQDAPGRSFLLVISIVFYRWRIPSIHALSGSVRLSSPWWPLAIIPVIL